MIQRRGFSLIEMLLTMTVGSALMVLAMTLLQQAMTLSSQTRGQCESDRATHRLCEQFRRDAHIATTVTTQDNLETIFTVDSERITYQILDGAVTRTTSTGHQGQERSGHEQYELGESTSVTIERLEQPERVSLTVRRQPMLKHVGPRIDRQIAVTVGRLAVGTASEETQL